MTKQDTKHTPTPWRYEAATKTIRSDPANYWLASMDSWDGAVNHDHNAEFIVKCVNAHDRLVEALRDLLEVVECTCDQGECTADNVTAGDACPECQAAIPARAVLAELEVGK